MRAWLAVKSGNRDAIDATLAMVATHTGNYLEANPEADQTITAEESGVMNQIANELDVDRESLNRVRSEFHENLSAIQAIRRMAAEA